MEIDVFDRLFGDLSLTDSSNAPGVVAPTRPGVLRGESRRLCRKGGNSYMSISGISKYMVVLVFTPVLSELWHF